MENKLKCLKCGTGVENNILCPTCLDKDNNLGKAIASIERICMCEGFYGTAEAMQIMRIKCGCDKCGSLLPSLMEMDAMTDKEMEDIVEGEITHDKDGNQTCDECGDQVITCIDGICNICTSLKDENDVINYPKHYNTAKIQPIDVIEDWKLDFRLANSVKYIQRHLHKGSAKKDLEKAIWYIQRYIDKELDKDGK